MNRNTKLFIDLYKHDPLQACLNIDKFSMMHPYFDGKKAAEMCRLVWKNGNYLIKRKEKCTTQ